VRLLAEISRGSQFGGRVAELVAAVTNPEYEPGRNKRANTAART
jgi:hypothetical protein